MPPGVFAPAVGLATVRWKCRAVVEISRVVGKSETNTLTAVPARLDAIVNVLAVRLPPLHVADNQPGQVAVHFLLEHPLLRLFCRLGAADQNRAWRAMRRLDRASGHFGGVGAWRRCRRGRWCGGGTGCGELGL